MCIAALQLHSADGKTLVGLSFLFCLPLPPTMAVVSNDLHKLGAIPKMSLSNFHWYHCHQNTQTIIMDRVGVLIISATLHKSHSLTNQPNVRRRLTVTYRNATHTNRAVRRVLGILLGRHTAWKTSMENTI